MLKRVRKTSVGGDVARGMNKDFRRRTVSGKATRIVQPTAHGRSVEAGVVETTQDVVLYYYSDWMQPILHYSLNRDPWKDAEFSQVDNGSRLRISILKQIEKSRWKMIRLDAGGKESPRLEFVITDGNGHWDKLQTGGNYEIGEAGNYIVQGGTVSPRSEFRPVLVVSDLDGTMVGDDASTEDFRIFWNLHSALTQSILVYNTGRSLGAFLKLLEEKRNCLEVPSMLISAVGTKIYIHATGSWEEDRDWINRLNEHWHLEVVQSAAKAVLDAVGKDNMHFRPDEEQNEHKVTCGLRHWFVDEAVADLEARFEKEGVKANVIVSGIGDWRFLDIVPKNAGKLEALNYVREHYGYSQASTVACGDSGSNLGIVVGNAQPDLLKWVERQRSTQGHRLYVSNQHEARGIVEGLKHFAFA